MGLILSNPHRLFVGVKACVHFSKGSWVCHSSKGRFLGIIEEYGFFGGKGRSGAHVYLLIQVKGQVYFFMA